MHSLRVTQKLDDFFLNNFLHKGKNLFLFDIIFILQYHSLLCNNIIPTQSQFSLLKQLISNTTEYFFFVHLYCF
jgi:hypothetical protein